MSGINIRAFPLIILFFGLRMTSPAQTPADSCLEKTRSDSLESWANKDYAKVKAYLEALESPLVTIPCESAGIACSANTYTFPSGTTGIATPPVAGYPNYGCMGGRMGPAWYYMQVSSPGDIIITITQVGLPPTYPPHDVDFVCWGPFTSLSEGCATGLTGTCPGPGNPCCSNVTTGCIYPKGNLVDCSFSGLATETCHILNAQVGEIYILLMTNFSSQPGTITFSQTGGSGVTDCDAVVHCTMVALTATPSACVPATNMYSISGNIEFTNSPSTGTLTVSDVTAVPPVSQVFTPPFTSPKAYTLSSIPCDGLVHTVTAVFSDSTSCNLNQQYTAPGECVQAQISGGGTICNNGSNTATVQVDFTTGAAPYTFTYAIDGISQPAVTNYSGPFPWTLSTSTAGTYTLLSVSNAVCSSGSVSGSAIVTLKPVPVITNPSSYSICSGTPTVITLASSPVGATFDWTLVCNNISSGCPLPGTGPSLILTPVTASPAGGTVSYQVVPSLDGCSGISFPMVVEVNPLPSPSITGPASLCAGTSGVLYITAAVAGHDYSWTVTGAASFSGENTSSLTVNWGTGSAGAVALTETDQNMPTACSQTTAPYPVILNPNPIPLISGNASPCGMSVQTYSLGAAQSGHTYIWTVNGGSPSAGSNHDITVSWGNSNPVSIGATETISYAGGVYCSAQAPSFPITLLPLPDPAGPISGTSPVCSNWNRTYSTALISNADTYEWWYIPPAGATITGNGNTVSIQFDPTAGSGSLFVKGNRTGCGDGLPSPSFPVTVNPLPYVLLSACNDAATTTASRSIVLKGGVPPGGQYFIDGNFLAGGILDPSVITVSSHLLTYRYTDRNSCSTESQPVPIAVYGGSAPGSCPGTFTDVRDGRIYQSGSWGGKCWMLANLDYGARMLSDIYPQTDNCMAEKYCTPSDANCTIFGGLYQWGELMDYANPSAVQPIQGLCPPEWHIPTLSEWQTLIDSQVNAGNGIAGGDLKDPNPTFGFNAVLGGFLYMNNFWAFTSASQPSTMFWSSTGNGATRAFARGLQIYNYSVSLYSSSRENAFSVRCVKD